MKLASVILALLALIVAIPLGMRSDTAPISPSQADDQLVILSPHNESIRREFDHAFVKWWFDRTGRRVYLDWRTPGGTSEISMVIDAGYKAARETGRKGIGVDVFFGGGQPDFSKQARAGRLVPLDVFSTHPEWFGEDGAIPSGWTGETYYPPEHNWVGCSLAQFGIALNPDVLKRLDLPKPGTWDDLGDAKLAGAVALADPSKSGSVARAFELLVQEQIQRVMAKSGKSGKSIAEGWEEGLRLIMRMSANARYFTDSASKIPHDVGQGDAAAGMCIDFYGRSYHEDRMRPDGTSRVEWIAPRGGATYSADPVAVFRGAPHPEIAQAFVEFCVSMEGQRLWCEKPGTPGGPQFRQLHRLPIRKDAYREDQTNPYEDKEAFIYDRELTGRAFNTLRQFVRIACIDSHDELKQAWQAVRENGYPPEAMAVMFDVSAFPYEKFGRGNPVLDGADSLAAAELASTLGREFRANYRRARHLAERKYLPASP